ncbi:MAG: metalloprotease TldD, partial [Gammaproteobacteria bacterium]|nr:metalloprotease TldD [Gammaproteobacteria bacterium]
MSDIQLDKASSLLLAPSGLDEKDLQKVLDQLMGHAVDSADLYFQLTRHEAWVLEDGIVKEGSFNIEQGVGVRAISGEKTGFAYSDEIVLPALTEAAHAARAIARSGRQGQVQSWHKKTGHDLYLPADPIESLTAEEKIDLLRRLDAEARRIDPRVKQVIVSLVGVDEAILIAASDGTYSGDIRPLVRMNVSIIAEDKGRREQANAGGGGRVNYSYFVDEEDRAMGFVREAVRQALVNLEAVDAPAGSMPV